MGIASAAVSQQLSPNTVQVDYTTKGGYTRYYEVPKQNAKPFSLSMIKQEKDMRFNANLVFFSSMFVGIFGAAMLTRNMESRMMQFLIQTASGIGLSFLSAAGMEKLLIQERKDIENHYGATELFYDA